MFGSEKADHEGQVQDQECCPLGAVWLFHRCVQVQTFMQLSPLSTLCVLLQATTLSHHQKMLEETSLVLSDDFTPDTVSEQTLLCL